MNEKIFEQIKWYFECNQPTSIDVNAKLHLLFFANIEENLEADDGCFYCFLIQIFIVFCS